MIAERDQENLQSITCGVIDKRYGQALEGTHHAVLNGRTLCGQSARERETRSTIWFNLGHISLEQCEDGVTCHACRRSLGLSKQHGDSRVLL